MTRFEQELSGGLGEYWKNHALNELESVKKELATGQITIDEKGVARNCIGRVVMSDMLERLMHVTDKVNAAETIKAREAEVAKELEDYRKNKKPPTEAELDEMRSVFGSGTEVIDVIIGDKIII